MDSIVISLGGSVFLGDTIHYDYILQLRDLLCSYTDRYYFILVVGGGRTAREYQKAYQSAIDNAEDAESDKIGIAATRLNAELVRAIFQVHAPTEIIMDPNQFHDVSAAPFLLTGGWKPGFSTDAVAVHLARQCRAAFLINLSDIDYVYSSNPKEDPQAKICKQMSWAHFIDMFPKEWSPGLHSPFDPIAAQEAMREGLRVIIAQGKNLENLRAILDAKPFLGTELY